MRNNLESSVIRDSVLSQGLRLSTLTQVLGAALVVTDEFPPLLNLDCGGAGRNVTFPAPSAVNEGSIWLVNNWSDAAEDITVKNSAASTIGTISQNEAGLVIIAGGVTYLRLVGTTT